MLPKPLRPQLAFLCKLPKIDTMKIYFAIVALLLCGSASAQTKSIAEQLAQQQLDAYNKRDIEAFLLPYSDSVAVYMFPDKLMLRGKEAMRQQYAEMFQKTPDLFCDLQNRIALKNTVIDHEKVTFAKGQPPLYAIAVYTIEKDKIAKVHFIMPQ
jgi:hypothetical protein